VLRRRAPIVLAVLALALGSRLAAAGTSLWVRSEPDDPVGGGVERAFGSADGSFTGGILFYFFPRLGARWHPSLRDRPTPQTTSLSQLAGIAVTQAAILTVFALAGRPLLYGIVWLAPLLTLVPLANQLRTLAEHASLDGSPITRTVLTGAAGRVVLAPVLFFYHHEHHLHPSVPFYRLPDLHRRLRESGHYDEPPAVVAPSYTQTLTSLAHGEVPPEPAAP
jgi:fatty acid desaturase